MLRKPTTIARATVQEAPLVILGPEEDGRGTRRVTLLVQDEPTIEIAFDVKPGSADARDSYWAQLAGGQGYRFEILPEQCIVGRAVQGIHELAVIVEYLA